MNDSKATSSPVLHTIGFDITTGPEREAVVLVDGRPLPVQTADGFLGYDPAELFDASLPLLATQHPHRVSIARCSCGVPGCGNITPLVSTSGVDDELVVWSDFRDLGSHVASPTEVDPEALLEPIDPPRQDAVVFDRLQYESAVLAASADRFWEAPQDVTARLLRGLLVTDAAVVRSLGFEPGWVAPSWNRPGWWTVTFDVPWPRRTEAQQRADARARAAELPKPAASTGWRIVALGRDSLRLRPWEREPRQVLLELTTTAAGPAQQAADLYRQLWDVPLADWERTFPWTAPHPH